MSNLTPSWRELRATSSSRCVFSKALRRICYSAQIVKYEGKVRDTACSLNLTRNLHIEIDKLKISKK